MKGIVLGITILSSLIISIVGFILLGKKSIFKFLIKKNTTAERWATQSKPIFGGLMFYLCFLCALCGITCVYGIHEMFSHLCIFVCVSLSFFMGMFDDLKNQGPLKKFISQILSATILIMCNIHIEISGNMTIDILLTYFWIVGIMNSINMLDNMDAITGLVSITILGNILGIAIFSENTDVSSIVILGAITTSICVYLYWNWNPSKIYMGDNGSQFLGIVLAIFSIKYIWNTSYTVHGFIYQNVVLIALAFLLPIIDTTVVFINRIAAGKSPFIGDRYHTTHNLVYMGMSEKGVARLFATISLISNSFVFYIIVFKPIRISMLLYILILVYIATLFISFFAISRYVKIKKITK